MTIDVQATPMASKNACRAAAMLSSKALEGDVMEPDDLVNTATDHGCFGCGEQNPIGLRLKFHRVDGSIRATFTPEKIHEGYAQMTHGGIVATLLDEAMSWAVIDRGHLAVTAKMDVQFRRPVPIGEPLVVSARVERDRKRLLEATGELRTLSGDLLASASGTFMRVSEAQQRAWEAIYGGPKRDAGSSADSSAQK